MLDAAPIRDGILLTTILSAAIKYYIKIPSSHRLNVNVLLTNNNNNNNHHYKLYKPKSEYISFRVELLMYGTVYRTPLASRVCDLLSTLSTLRL